MKRKEHGANTLFRKIKNEKRKNKNPDLKFEIQLENAKKREKCIYFASERILRARWISYPQATNKRCGELKNVLKRDLLYPDCIWCCDFWLHTRTHIRA